MRRNYAWGSRRVVDWRRVKPEGLRKTEDVDIRVTISPIDVNAKHAPLPFLAQALMESYGRERGIHTEVLTIQRADFGPHEGVVVYARRKADLVERKVAQIFVRAGNELVMVSYIAPPDLYAKYAPEFTEAVERFSVLLPPDRPSIGLTLPEDLPEDHRAKLNVLATPTATPAP